MFVDGMLEVGDLTETDRDKIDATLGANRIDVTGCWTGRLGAFGCDAGRVLGA